MKQINAKPRQTIPLGHRGENEARQVIFDLTDYINVYGTGTARLLHQRDGDPAPYIVPAAQSDTTLIWAVTDEDTAAPGTGSAELQWTVENVLAKSDIWCTKTKAALDDGSTAPPTGAEGWYQQLIAYIDSLRDDGVTPEQIAAAVEAYLAENPVQAPVQSVNGKTGAVELTAEDVGALDQDDLQTGVNAALAQAKASGEFDGQAGDDGGYYTPSVDAGGNLGWTGSKADMPAVAGANIKGPPGTTGKSAYQYAKDGGFTGTETEFAAKLADEYIQAPVAAEVGQTIVVKAVDENGKPTEWEAVDVASGGSSAWELIADFTLSEDGVSEITISEDTNGAPFELTAIYACIFGVGSTESGVNISCKTTSNPNYPDLFHNFGLLGSSLTTGGKWSSAYIERVGGVNWNTAFKGTSTGAATPAQTKNYDTYIKSSYDSWQAKPDGKIRSVKLTPFSGTFSAGTKLILYGKRV